MVKREARLRRYGWWNAEGGFGGVGGRTPSEAPSGWLVGPEQVLDDVRVLVSECCSAL